MAKASTSPNSRSLEEKIDCFKLMRLIIDVGTEALRNEFKKIHPGNLHRVLGSHKGTLNNLKKKKIITQPQWDKLYPPVHMIPNIKEFDITLLVILLRNICGITAPITTGWNKMPVNSDTSLGANIVRVKLFRNEFFGHIPVTGVNTTVFEARWKEVSRTLVHLGISQTDIDRLKDEECGEQEVDRIRREWNENDTKVAFQLLELKKMCTENREVLMDIRSDVESMKSEKSSGDDILKKYLDLCDFRTDIDSLYQKLCEGTREWVFDEVSEWFNDTTSESRAFIITGQAGMGKSVIAAVICKRFAEQFAACHFCQYNNDRYDNPKILLQSLASQLSNVIPEYKKALIEKLSSMERERLKNMNIQGLFTLLFKEPLTGVHVTKRLLIVIDAVDESAYKERSDLVDLIANYLGRLPTFIRFVITSRPEHNIAEKLKDLKPMFLSPNDPQNLKDLLHFFEAKLSCTHKEKQVSMLVEKCDGLMLFANCLLNILEDDSLELEFDDLPSGISKIYESYFKRWGNEFRNANVGENDFLKFLGVMAVAKQPLPEELIQRVFDFEKKSSSIAMRKINRITNCLSLLIVTQQGRLTFFHKSVKDWLVDLKHDFTVNEQLSHENLAEICAQEMDEMKMNRTKSPFQPAAKYALLYGIQHKLSGTQDKPLDSFIDKYVIDLEIMYASVTVNVDETLNNISSLKKDTNYNTSSVPEQTRKNVEELMSLIRRHSNILRDIPQSFLQHMLNWGEGELSLNAKSLLESRYKDLAYFELVEKGNTEHALIGRIYTDGFSVWDFLPSEDYVVCYCCSHNIIELFSIADFKSLWTIEDVELTFPSTAYLFARFYRPLVFHPIKRVILPGRLDIVINLQGNFESGPFLYQDRNSHFNNSCFSNDCTKFVTTWGKLLTVWDLESNKELISFSTDENLISISFSANDKFLACSGEKGKVGVYDVEKDFFCIKSNTFDKLSIFMCSFASDSWHIIQGGTMQSPICKISSDLTAPCLAQSHCQYLPLNVKAVEELKMLVENRQESFLKHFNTVMSFCLDSGRALVFVEGESWALQLYNVSKLKKNKPEFSFNPGIDLAGVKMSVDGKFLYLKSQSRVLIHKLDDSCQPNTSPADLEWAYSNFTPVTNGMITINLPPNREKFLHKTVPQLWSSDMTQCLDTFPQLSGISKCESVSEQVIACFKEEELFFFNFVKKEIVSTTHFPEHIKVVAYSSKYHVVLKEFDSILSLWRNGKFVDKWQGVLNELEMEYTKGKIIFSPSGDKLMFCINCDLFHVFEVFTAKLLRKIDFKTVFSTTHFLYFLDEDHLLCLVSNSLEFIVNVASGKTINYIDFSESMLHYCKSRKQDDGTVLICIAGQTGTTKLAKVWLPS